MVCCLQLSHFPRFWDLFPWYLWVWPYSWQIYKPKDLSESGKNRAAPCCESCHAWCREKWKEVTSSGDLNEESQQVFHIHKTRQEKRRIKQPLQKSFCGRPMTVNSSHIEWFKDSRFGESVVFGKIPLRWPIEVWLDTDRALERWSKIALYCGSVQMPSPQPDRSVQVHLKTHFMGWDMLSVLMHACRLHIYTEFSRCILCALVVQQFKNVSTLHWQSRCVTMIAMTLAEVVLVWLLLVSWQTVPERHYRLVGKHEMPWNAMKCHEMPWIDGPFLSAH